MCVLKGRSVIGKYKEASARRKEATDDETETSG